MGRYEAKLLKFFRLDLDTYAPDEQVALYEETCRRTNEFLEASRRFVNFLEFGTPGRDLRSEVENIERDVRSAVLRDAGDLTYRQIGEVLDVPPPPDIKDKGDHPTVRQMVRRGRAHLERVLGEEGWREKAKDMKAEAQRQRDAGLELQAYLVAEEAGVPEEEVRSKIDYDPVHGLVWLDQEREAEWLQRWRASNRKNVTTGDDATGEADTQGQER